MFVKIVTLFFKAPERYAGGVDKYTYSPLTLSSGYTLIDLVQTYLKEKGEYSPENPNSFPPSLCHRLDRNTGFYPMKTI